jgi:hypothetical protein
MTSNPVPVQKQLLRGNLGLILVWAVVGCLLGILLKATFSAAGFGSSSVLSESNEVAVMIAAYFIVGIIVLSGIVKAYREPPPVELSEGPRVPTTETKQSHFVTRHLVRRQEETRAEELDRL